MVSHAMAKSGGYDKSAHTMIAPELLVPCTDYAFTLNPCDKLQYDESNSLRRFSDFKSQMRVSLQNLLSPYMRWKFYIEISKAGRLHLHGTVSFNDLESILMFFMSAVTKLQAQFTYELDTIKDPKIWHDYCTKQEQLFGDRMQELNSTKPIPVLVGVDAWVAK